jgi:hypothetical protein
MSCIAGHGEVNEISGTELLLEAGARRPFCGSGDPFGRSGSFFDGVFVRPRHAGSLVAPLDVRQAAGDYLPPFSLIDVANLLDSVSLLMGKPGGTYVFSNRQAYDDEQRFDLVRLWNWADHLGLRLEGSQPQSEEGGKVVKARPVDGYLASGRAAAAEFVRRVRPQRLVAIHTENAAASQDLLRGMPTEWVIPKYAEPVQL